MLTAINVPDISPADDVFTRLQTRHPLNWVRLTGLPSNPLERLVRGIRISRYRAALQAARAASAGSFVISHMPLMTAAVASALKLARRGVPHLGFAFNFTDLPVGWRRRYLHDAFRHVDQLTVFSAYEKTRYAEFFDIDQARLAPVVWAQQTPPVAPEPVLALKSPYLCAIGGEGRDFSLLMEVARRLGPSVSVVVIAWSRNLARLAIPDNVKVLTDVPVAQTWRIAMDSQGVLVPLLARETCCGQITIVSAKLLGLPLATTHAYATREYVEGRAGVLACEPGDVAGFAESARELLDGANAFRQAARSNVAEEHEIHHLRHWADYLDGFVSEWIQNRGLRSSVSEHCNVDW